MEHFIVSARKYRPQTFKDVVGQQAITNTLLNAIESNHLAQALLFCGPRGVGKTTCARILAKKINEDGTQTPDEDFAFNIFELDAASNNSVDDIRSLIDQVRIPPQTGKFKVYIIDEVHMLSQAAFNAFLKTLEEPPKHAIFILATTEKHKIIPTILSRCQIFDFKRITIKDAKEYLAYIAKQQGIEAEDDALHIIAQKADGAMRDALSIFDRVVSYSGKQLTRKAVAENLNVLDYDTFLRATDLIFENNIPQLLLDFNETLSHGFDGHHFIAGLATHFRDLMVCKNEATLSLLDVSSETAEKYREQSKKADIPILLKCIELANECDLNYKTSKNQRLLVELCLMQLASVTFNGEKKNSNEYIIPSTHFTEVPVYHTTTKPAENSLEAAVKTPETHTEEYIQKPQPVAVNEPEPMFPSESRFSDTTKKETPPLGKKVSGLSLSSIRAKKEFEKNKRANHSVQTKKLPEDTFTEEKLVNTWELYVAQLDKQGKKIMASNLSADTPKLKENHIIWIELPNETMKKEIERESYPLMEYLKDTLNNHKIELEISVNETTAKKYAFTPIEKYEKLREKNPQIDVLRKTFDLDI
ncbi:DNA polymerase III subunit gamma/tau [Ascidiimonas aurantiaca]|uniref:DNA polymerase III subunit gamma/tau n=1 Tax=Ascidiimonas aurantiaca TaxID=1685432 RepID=UPI0030EC915A